MAKGIFISVNMKSTRYAARIYDAVADIDIENGMFGYLGDLDSEGDTVYKFIPGLPANGEEIVVVDQPAWDYDESKRTNQRKDMFYIPAGMKFRVRAVATGDEFGISEDNVTTATRDALNTGAFLTIDATGKLIAQTGQQNAAFEAKVLRKRKQGGTLVTPVREYGSAKMIYEAKVKLNTSGAGAQGPQGAPGQNGVDGVGVKAIKLSTDNDGKVVSGQMTKTDDTTDPIAVAQE